jgi:hypothetical protein
LARATARQKEFGVRLALGAGRGRLVRQLLTESLLLALMGALVGAVAGVVDGAGAWVPGSAIGIPIAQDTHMNGDILAFTMLLCVAVCVVSGMAPAWHTVRTDLNDTLKDGGRSGSAGQGSRRLRSLLVVSEVALALVAIIGAGLFARSFQLARQIDPGFDASHMLVANLSLSSAGYAVPDRKQFCYRLRERLEKQPGIVGVTYADFVPLGFDSGPWEELEIEGYEKGRAENMQLYRNVVAPGYFKVVGIPLLDGRDFTEQDDLSKTATPVMIVNETFARRYFGGGYPIGRKVHGWGEWFTVVGVVKDSKYHTPNESAAAVFLRAVQAGVPGRFECRGLRARGGRPEPGAGDAAARGPLDGSQCECVRCHAVDGVHERFPVRAEDRGLAAGGAGRGGAGAGGGGPVRRDGVFHHAAQAGDRHSRGAGRAVQRCGRDGVADGMGLTAAGLLVGVLAAVAVTRVVSGLLVNVSATDPLIFGGAALFLAVVALVASGVPAIRAARTDPNSALRCG